MTTANTHDCFREFIGQRLVGLLFSALPLNDRGLAAGNRSLVFEDGRALTLSDNGSYWIDSAKDVARAVERKKDELDHTSREIAEVIALAGQVSA